jgi:hypothetical protein
MSKSNNHVVPMKLSSSKKTMVGLSPGAADARGAVTSTSLPSPQRAQRTLLGCGPEHGEAVDAFIAASRGASTPPARAAAVKKTLLGLAPEPEPPPSYEPPSLGPLSMSPVSLGPGSMGSLPDPYAGAPSPVNLPFERPLIAAASIAAVVALWALMMLYLFSL